MYPSTERYRGYVSHDLIQNRFSFSDKGIEESIYGSYAMRRFPGIDSLDEQVPDATPLLKFRHLLEQYHIGGKIFQDVNDYLEKVGLIMHSGSIINAATMAALGSTKSKEGKRDPEMHQTKKGKQWYQRIKAHAGANSEY